MRVRWAQTAFAELGEIRSYIAKDNPAAGKAVVLRIEQVTARLGRFPRMGSATDAPEFVYSQHCRFLILSFTPSRLRKSSFATSAMQVASDRHSKMKSQIVNNTADNIGSIFFPR